MGSIKLSDLVALPALGERFSLTMGDHISPTEMIRNDFGYWSGWQYSGSNVETPQTSQFKLIQVGTCESLEGVKVELKRFGIIPEGQWREVFKKTFSLVDRHSPIGIARSDWVYDGVEYFPILSSIGLQIGSRWETRFRRADMVYFSANWRWLMECP